MSAEDLEREIRSRPTMNERFLLSLLDETRKTLSRTEDGWREANAECIKHWNRADAAEAELTKVREQSCGCV